ncbi:hypothetical protein [Mycoplasma sp. 3686d]|uniref:hypothetical protein n=1 Tax=Mycoplasma sp. 3686d TaxID=2967300 RepID=UPI00211C7CF4|nr:hypothetical protein [Mycoplasma sp. 3686d]UUM24571.1 hypothetical protein NPA12_02615 [Mycoplasma sp. 3686d]
MKIKRLLIGAWIAPMSIFLSSCSFSSMLWPNNQNSFDNFNPNNEQESEKEQPHKFRSELETQDFLGFDDAFDYFLTQDIVPESLEYWTERKNEFLQNQNWIKTKLEYKNKNYTDELSKEEKEQIKPDEKYDVPSPNLINDAKHDEFNYEHIWFNKKISDLQFFFLFAIKGKDLAKRQMNIINALIEYKKQQNQDNFNHLIRLFVDFINCENYALFKNAYDGFYTFFDFENFDYSKGVNKLYEFLIHQKQEHNFVSLQDEQLDKKIKLFTQKEIVQKIWNQYFKQVNFNLLVQKPPKKEDKDNNQERKDSNINEQQSDN